MTLYEEFHMNINTKKVNHPALLTVDPSMVHLLSDNVFGKSDRSQVTLDADHCSSYVHCIYVWS